MLAGVGLHSFNFLHGAKFASFALDDTPIFGQGALAPWPRDRGSELGWDVFVAAMTPVPPRQRCRALL